VRIVVRNLSYRAVEGDLRALFSRHGVVAGVTLSRGSGIVEMSDPDEGRAAIRALDGRRIHGRPVELSEADASGAWLMDVQEAYADFGRS